MRGFFLFCVKRYCYTLELTGVVTRAVSLEEGHRDPAGRIARLSITLPTLEALEELELETGENYLVYGMDYVDLYQIHRLDANTPMEEIMEALHDVVKSGKARYIGASTIFAWQLERMQQIAERNGWTKFVSLQPQYNLIYREEEREILPLCRDRKMAVVPWSPLAGGRCAHPWGTKTARNAIDEVSPMVWGATDAQDKVVVDNLEKVAAANGRTMAQESLAWMLSKPEITAPSAASKPTIPV